MIQNRDGFMIEQGRVQKDVVIRNDCWTCGNAATTALASIADGCICAIGTVVTKIADILYSIIDGVPEKMIGIRRINTGKAFTATAKAPQLSEKAEQ